MHLGAALPFYKCSDAEMLDEACFSDTDLYSTANDPQPQMILRPQMIPKMDRK